ncbi:MAG: anion permease [Bacteroidetes bacterium]|nr:MAG: anion permease [Bacteroidota bacterium]
MIILIILGALMLAWVNGANDNFKGVATLFGSKTTPYKRAIAWATLTTFAGSLTAIWLAGQLVQHFSGKGLVPDALVQSPAFALSIALGAAATVLFATKIGMPVSTTHSLIGALFGSGMLAVGSAFNFGHLWHTFLMPLLVSPLLAGVFSFVVYRLFKRARLTLGLTKETCACIGGEFVPVNHSFTENGILLATSDAQTTLSIDTQTTCVERYRGQFIGISAQSLLDGAHYLSAGVVSFARGLNDTPKIVGLMLVVQAFDIHWGLLPVAIAMAAGGLIHARKVARTISQRITPMNPGQGFTANLATGLLVTTASVHGLPVSTTHVSVGAIFGIGQANQSTDYGMLRKILGAWVLTLPVAAIFSAIAWLIISSI